MSDNTVVVIMKVEDAGNYVDAKLDELGDEISELCHDDLQGIDAAVARLIDLQILAQKIDKAKREETAK